MYSALYCNWISARHHKPCDPVIVQCMSVVFQRAHNYPLSTYILCCVLFWTSVSPPRVSHTLSVVVYYYNGICATTCRFQTFVAISCVLRLDLPVCSVWCFVVCTEKSGIVVNMLSVVVYYYNGICATTCRFQTFVAIPCVLRLDLPITVPPVCSVWCFVVCTDFVFDPGVSCDYCSTCTYSHVLEPSIACSFVSSIVCCVPVFDSALSVWCLMRAHRIVTENQEHASNTENTQCVIPS